MIIGLVAMYMPQKKEIDNISKYISQLDYCYLLDDSAKDNSKAVDSLIKKFPEKVEYHMNVQNIGLVRSVNNGFKLAIEKGADWILVMIASVFSNNGNQIVFIRTNPQTFPLHHFRIPG
mgnify:CR=1 FL=1